MYVFYNENSNNILQRLILDYDKIPIVVNVHYNANILQNIRVKDSKYICKEIQLNYLECPSLVNYEKQNARAHTYTNINAWTLIYTHKHTHIHSRMHRKVRVCRTTCRTLSRRLDPSSCLSKYLKRSYLVNLLKYRLF